MIYEYSPKNPSYEINTKVGCNDTLYKKPRNKLVEFRRSKVGWSQHAQLTQKSNLISDDSKYLHIFTVSTRNI